MSDDEEKRFWARVVRGSGRDSCWEFPTRSKRGIPMFWRRALRKPVQAYKFAWESARGAVPQGLLVCHRCDNPRCVRLSHLFIGTDLDNMRDKIAKDRETRGEAVVTAKLTEEQVLELREEKRRGATLKQLAKRYGICWQHVWSITAGRSWKKVG